MLFANSKYKLRDVPETFLHVRKRRRHAYLCASVFAMFVYAAPSFGQELGSLLQEGFAFSTQEDVPAQNVPAVPPEPTTPVPSLVAPAAQNAAEPAREELAVSSAPKVQEKPLVPEKEKDVSGNTPVRFEEPSPSPQTAEVPEVLGAKVFDLGASTSLKPDTFEPMGVEDAVSYALENNFEVLSMASRKVGSRWDYASAYTQYIPSIEVTYAQGAERSSPGSYNDPAGGRIKKTTHQRRDRAVHVRQSLIDLAIVADIMKASDTVELADAEERDSREATVFATVTTFLKLLQAKQTIELFDEHKKTLADLSERMTARLEEGGATGADVNKIASRLSAAEAARLEALGVYGTTLAEFKRLTKVVPARFKMPEKLVPDVPPSPDAALAEAWRSNPTYLAGLKKVDLARRDRDKSFAGTLPKVSVEYSDVFSYNAGGTAHGSPVDGVYPNQRDERVMLVAKWSLTGLLPFTSGMSGVEKTEEMSLKAGDIRARIEQGVHTAYDGLTAARERVALLSQAYVTDKKVVAELEEQFATGGNRSLFEILDSRDRLHETKVALVRATFAQALSAYQVRMQMGEVVRAVLGDAQEEP